MKKLIIICKFMGWHIDVEIDSKYPLQEWRSITNGKETIASRCLFLDEKDLNVKREFLDESLWAELTDINYGLCRKYTYSLDALIPVINKLILIKKDMNDRDFIDKIKSLENLKITSKFSDIFKETIELIMWLSNEQI